MKLNAIDFLRSYEIDELCSREGLSKVLLDMSINEPDEFVKFKKNLLALRVLFLTDSEYYIKEFPHSQKDKLVDIFKKKRTSKMLTHISNELEIKAPELVMQIVPAFISVSSIIIWTVIVIGFLYRNIELLFSGLDLIIIPFTVIIIAAPAVLLRFIFQDFFAPHVIDKVESFKEFIDKLYTMNQEKFGVYNIDYLVNQLQVVCNHDR